MLYWGIFTSGFIIGGVFASFILTHKETGRVVSNTSLPVVSDNITDSNPDKLFEQLTQINYSPEGFIKNLESKIGNLFPKNN